MSVLLPDYMNGVWVTLRGMLWLVWIGDSRWQWVDVGSQQGVGCQEREQVFFPPGSSSPIPAQLCGECLLVGSFPPSFPPSQGVSLLIVHPTSH